MASTTATASTASASCRTIAGEWRYTTHSNPPELDGKTGVHLHCTPRRGITGPVRVEQHVTHFAYADGTPYFPVGTTCYAWTHQGDALEEQTLATLRDGAVQQDADVRLPEALRLQQERAGALPVRAARAPSDWDFTRFNPAFFRHLEQRIGHLRDLGIEADLILFHPYDRWGFDRDAAAKPTTATCATSSPGSPPTATSGGRWPTSSTS